MLSLEILPLLHPARQPHPMTSNPDVPPFTGYVETTLNALRLIHAARQGVIPRITRRLNDSERRTMIKSGAVFVFSVDESGIKRWTDGLLWSPSRIVGNFLVYREINERTNSRSNQRKVTYIGESQSRELVVSRNSPDQPSTLKSAGHLLHGVNDLGTFKVDGLIKKTITVTIDGSDLHLISYYTSEDIRSGKLRRPSHRSDIMSLPMPPHIFRLTNFRVPPKVEIGSDGKPRLVCEADDLEPSAERKVEEQTHRVSSPPQWASSSVAVSPLESEFAGNSLYHEPHVKSPSIYTHETANSRWSIPLESLRTSPLSRQDVSWSPTPSPTLLRDSVSRRRDVEASPQHGSWPILHTQPQRWRSDSYDAAGSNGGHSVERSRFRSNTLYDTSGAGAHRRDCDSSQGYHRVPAELGGQREVARLPWLPRDSSAAGERNMRGPRAGSSFTPSPTLPFSNHSYNRLGHSYSTSWGTGEDCLTDPTMQQIPSHSVNTYHTYTSSSPEGYSMEDYTSK